jgi:hypothetical protein
VYIVSISNAVFQLIKRALVSRASLTRCCPHAALTVCWSRRCAVYCNTSKCTRVLLQYVLEYVRTRGPTYSSVRTNVVRTEVLEYLGYDVVRQQSSLL